MNINSYRTLNQIFYKNNKFYSIDTLESLVPFFYTKTEDSVVSNIIIHKQEQEQRVVTVVPPIIVLEKPVIIQQSISPIVETPIIVSEKTPPIQNKQDWIEPREKDSIFWCIFICVHGHNEYMQIGNRYGNRELEEKYKIIEFLKKNPKLLKESNQKITNGMIQEILSEFMIIQNQTSLLGLCALAIYYKIQIILVDSSKKIGIQFLPKITEDFIANQDGSYKTCILYKNERQSGKYKIHSYDETNDMIEELDSKIFMLEQFSKPLKAISNYTVSQLIEISIQLGIHDETIKMKKQDLYAKIVEYCAWDS